MAKDLDTSEIQDEYKLLSPICERFAVELERQILYVIQKENIRLAVPIQYRAKKWDSIFDKINQGRFNIKKTITELQDLVGLRIILLFKRDSERIAALLRDNFGVIKEYQTQDRLEDNQFGYSSIHQIIELPEDWLKIPSFKEFKNIKAEIQLRTLSQHAWAEASNFFQYKNEENVPKPLKRAVSRISALLETVDLEFERTLFERDNYKEEILEQNLSVQDNQVLNVDLIEQILIRNLPSENLKPREDYSGLFNDLKKVGINDTQSLEKLIREHLEDALKVEKQICQEMISNYSTSKQLKTSNPKDKSRRYVAETDALPRISKEIFFTHVGLIRHIIRYHAKEFSTFFDNSKK